MARPPVVGAAPPDVTSEGRCRRLVQQRDAGKARFGAVEDAQDDVVVLTAQAYGGALFEFGSDAFDGGAQGTVGGRAPSFLLDIRRPVHHQLPPEPVEKRCL